MASKEEQVSKKIQRPQYHLSEQKRKNNFKNCPKRKPPFSKKNLLKNDTIVLFRTPVPPTNVYPTYSVFQGRVQNRGVGGELGFRMLHIVQFLFQQQDLVLQMHHLPLFFLHLPFVLHAGLFRGVVLFLFRKQRRLHRLHGVPVLRALLTVLAVLAVFFFVAGLLFLHLQCDGGLRRKHFPSPPPPSQPPSPSESPMASQRAQPPMEHPLAQHTLQHPPCPLTEPPCQRRFAGMRACFLQTLKKQLIVVVMQVKT